MAHGAYPAYNAWITAAFQQWGNLAAFNQREDSAAFDGSQVTCMIVPIQWLGWKPQPASDQAVLCWSTSPKRLLTSDLEVLMHL